MTELLKLQTDLPPGITCTPIGDSIDHYTARITGPPETPYEAGQFHITISLPDNYPIEPPSMKFTTRIYHPNIDDHGNICLDVLKTGKKGGWNPAWTLGKVLLSLSALLGSPNPDDPLMPEIAERMVADYSAFATAAREWTAKYAAPVDDDDDDDGDGDNDNDNDNNGDQGNGAVSPDSVISVDLKDTAVLGKWKLGLSRKTSSPSPGPSLSSLLPPVSSGKLPGASGIRRLGLSRSRNTAAKNMPPNPAAAKAPSSLTVSSSQAESVDLTSDDNAADEMRFLAADNKPAKRSKSLTLSQILASSSQNRPPKPPTPLGSKRKKRGSVAMTVPAAAAALVKGVEEEGACVETQMEWMEKGASLDSLKTEQSNIDYDCLLSPDELYTTSVDMSIPESPLQMSSLQMTSSIPNCNSGHLALQSILDTAALVEREVVGPLFGSDSIVDGGGPVELVEHETGPPPLLLVQNQTLEIREDGLGLEAQAGCGGGGGREDKKGKGKDVDFSSNLIMC
ncbi:hypothetical protein LPJ66_006095 [Kickxella alabastrina]|uniref:Uncharacterized protein n=1 Tax=Kickxella alabastrina TaxID=61397 RepID=A0ACC1IL17_9FUNG|nr:hypothetical protein LPJ66_006095 [Kickxella alabastrina]